MDCHDVQQLLAFVNRPSEELDAPERDALRDHVEKCPDCAARLQADRRADEVFGPLMRNVSVPGDLKQKVLRRLSAERPRPWKTWVAAAAMVLVAVGTTAYVYWPMPEITMDILFQAIELEQKDDQALDKHFENLGMSAKVPRQMNYRFLNGVDFVDFNRRKVVKLSFSTMENPAAVAEVLILSEDQFRLGKLPQEEIRGLTTSIRIWREPDNPGFVYVAYFRGNINALMRTTV